jgi:hypothetical protein
MVSTVNSMLDKLGFYELRRQAALADIQDYVLSQIVPNVVLLGNAESGLNMSFIEKLMKSSE